MLFLQLPNSVLDKHGVGSCLIISKIRLMDKDLQKIRMVKILSCVGLYVSVDSYCIQMS